MRDPASGKATVNKTQHWVAFIAFQSDDCYGCDDAWRNARKGSLKFIT